MSWNGNQYYVTQIITQRTDFDNPVYGMASYNWWTGDNPDALKAFLRRFAGVVEENIIDDMYIIEMGQNGTFNAYQMRSVLQHMGIKKESING